MFRQSLKISQRLLISNRHSCIVLSSPDRRISFHQKSEKFKFLRNRNVTWFDYQSVHFSTTVFRVSDTYLQPTQRLVNPDQIDGVQYVESLCLSLHQSQPERYSFFSALANKRSAILTSLSTEGNISRHSSGTIHQILWEFSGFPT